MVHSFVHYSKLFLRGQERTSKGIAKIEVKVLGGAAASHKTWKNPVTERVTGFFQFMKEFEEKRGYVRKRKKRKEIRNKRLNKVSIVSRR